MGIQFAKYVLLLGLAVCPCLPAVADGDLVDAIAAQVNEKSIMVSDVLALLEPQRQKLENQYGGDQLKTELLKTYNACLNLLIEKRLILDAYEIESKEQGKKVPEQFVDERVDGLIRDIFKGDRVEMTRALEKDGMTFQEWRNEIKDQIIVASMRRANVEQNIRMTPQSVRGAYDKNIEKYKTPAKIKIRMIMLTKGASQDDTMAKALEIKKKAENGGDFAELARTYSEDDKAKDGGDWGWIQPEILRSELANPISSLRDGSVSGAIETESELYIIKCEGRGSEEIQKFEDVQPQIERELKQEQAKQLHDAWIARLKKPASIKVFDARPF